MAHSSRTHEDCQIGIICALSIEKAVMMAMLDETHPKLEKAEGDENKCTLSRFGGHNVVVTCLLASFMINGPAIIASNV